MLLTMESKTAAYHKLETLIAKAAGRILRATSPFSPRAPDPACDSLCFSVQ